MARVFRRGVMAAQGFLVPLVVVRVHAAELLPYAGEYTSECPMAAAWSTHATVTSG